MKKYLNIISIIVIALFAGCSENDDIFASSDEEQVYSFTAVIDEEPQSRVSYQEDENTKNLKLHWDDGDIIRLYPDASMGDDTEYYEFVAHTSQRTHRCAFIYQGVIPNWENWSGKAVYVWPDGENLTVEDDSKEFEENILTQKTNNDTEHLKYAEHVLGEDGTKNYRDFWKQNVKDVNLKDNYELCFVHPHTVIYALKLRGFIYDIPGGSILKVSGATWVDGDTISLNLGTKDDDEPFLKVGEFGRPGYDDSVVLTAYIIRQVNGQTDGSICEGDTLKIELLSYDKEDSMEYPLVEEDKQTHRTSKVDANRYGYFKNLPWGDEYTWEVKATGDISYNVGDYVVADLTDTNKDYAYPRIAIDLGMPRKWAAYNVGAKKTDDYGRLFVWGYTHSYPLPGQLERPSYPNTIIHSDTWSPGNIEHDPATLYWGNEWITPTDEEMFDLMYYCRIIDGLDNEMGVRARNYLTRWEDTTGREVYLWSASESCFFNVNDVRFCRLKSTLNDRYFSWPMSGAWSGNMAYTPGSIGCFYTHSWHTFSTNDGPTIFWLQSTGRESTLGLEYNATGESNTKAFSIRPVKRHFTN